MNDLMCQAQTQAHAGGNSGRKRKCVLHALSDGPTPASRCQRRNAARKIAAARRKLQLKRIKRRLACYRASGAFGTKRKGHVLVGSWNTRGLGAKFGKDPAGKIDAIFKVIAERRWSCALLTDLRFEEAGVVEVKVGGANWLLVHEGRVGVALSQEFAAKWRAGGSVVVRAKGWEGPVRAWGLKLPGRGWRPGLFLVPVYAPLVSKTTVEQRETFRDQLAQIISHSSSRTRLVVGGDFNGEVGALKDNSWKHVMGPYGDVRRTKGGEELLHFCEQEGLVVAGTFTQQREKATWFHCRFGTAHTLDHFLVDRRDRKCVASVLTVHHVSRHLSGPRGRQGRPVKFSSAPWLAHTDHEPIEMLLRIRKDWVAEALAREREESRPDVVRFLGKSDEAFRLRKEYAKQISEELCSVSGNKLDWDVLSDVMKKTALRVVGKARPSFVSRPWLRGKERELEDLESRVHVLEERLRDARRLGSSDVDILLRDRRLASQNLRKAKRRWEACWWDDLAEQANQAGMEKDDASFWRICKMLGFREGNRVSLGVRRTVAEAHASREEWRSFLSGIQSGRGDVNDAVWEFIPEAEQLHDCLALPPSLEEFKLALKKMQFGKRGGCDDITVELIRFAGEDLRNATFEVVRDMWAEAAAAPEGAEADSWCDSSKTGVCIPMFKNKGSRLDMNNYRNLVMLSVSAKLVARICASRLATWAEEWLPEQQNGFRVGRGIDDVQMVVRRLLEEIAVAANEGTYGMTCFDIVRAYTRVCRDALWSLLSRLGVPASFVQVLKALHEHTRFKVFVHNGYSSEWLTDRGLREGCPSSPILFSIFHHAVLLTFRCRRKRSAEPSNLQPGIPWKFKVDGHLTRPGRARHSSRGIREIVIGDVEFADDTALFGEVEELHQAEQSFIQTLRDWEQQEHPDKREKLVLTPRGRRPMDVLNIFEKRLLKHLGATHTDNADQWAETTKRLQAGFYAVKRIAKYWSLGSDHGRGRRSGLSTHRKLKIMRCVVEGTLLSCSKTRVWSLVQERKANQVISRGIRRCLGLDRFNMRQYGYADDRLRNMVQWNSFSELVHKQVLNWVGHVARMSTDRLPKIALFGWPAGLEEHHSGRFTYPRWVEWLLEKHNISVMDWFRLAQKPTTNWIKLVHQALPRKSLSVYRSYKVNVEARGPYPGLARSPPRCPECALSV